MTAPDSVPLHALSGDHLAAASPVAAASPDALRAFRASYAALRTANSR
jgi:hypothetical protein